MKKFIIGGVIIIALLGIVFISSPKSAEVKEPNTTVSEQNSTPSITFDTVQKAVAEGAKFYDVRTPEEFAVNRFLSAENWSLQSIEAGNLPPTAKDAPIYLYCNSGNRSGQATTLLKNAGYTNIIDLKGLTDVEAIGGTLLTN